MWYLNLFMNINVTTEKIDSCKLFNKMTKKNFTKEKNALLTYLRQNTI